MTWRDAGFGPVLATAGIVWVVVCGLVLLSPAVRRLPRAPEAPTATGSTYAAAG